MLKFFLLFMPQQTQDTHILHLKLMTRYHFFLEYIQQELQQQYHINIEQLKFLEILQLGT